MTNEMGSVKIEWTWDEHVLALDLYLQNPLSPPGKGSREVLELSQLLNDMGRARGVPMHDKYRNANGVYMKMMNFRRFDPHFQSQGKAGLSAGSKAEENVWNQFADDRQALRNAASEIRRQFYLQAAPPAFGGLVPVNFDAAYEQFLDLVAARDKGRAFVGFDQGLAAVSEDYKARLRAHALSLLRADAWSEADIGSGLILRNTIQAIEVQEPRLNLTNNLVFWVNRFGHAARDHKALLDATLSRKDTNRCERMLFRLFQGDEAPIFDELAEFVGHKYPLMAYLYYLKNPDAYMPIHPSGFDQAFSVLGIGHRSIRNCSWDNYRGYNAALNHIRQALLAKGVKNVELIDAHSFCWLLVKLEKEVQKPSSRATTDVGRRIGGQEKAIIDLSYGIMQTAQRSNGQTVERTVKNKELHMDRRELEDHLRELFKKQQGCCNLTGIPFHYDEPGADPQLRASPDRIDSNGHYVQGNIQLVCWFVNRWKSDSDNEEFMRLLTLVREGNGGAVN